MSGSSPGNGSAPPRAGAKILLAVGAVLVLGGTIALAIYVRSAAGGESEAPVVPPPARTTATPPAAPRDHSTSPAPALESHEMPLAEDRFLGQPGAPPSSGQPAPPPPDPPRAPTDPEPTQPTDPASDAVDDTTR